MKKRTKNNAPRGKRHGQYKHGWSCTPTMSCWQSMIKRCYDPKNDTYKYYGGVGRRVCERLRRGILGFVAVVGKKPEHLQIDRIDNSGQYSCGDCPECREKGWSMNLRWSTRKVQCRNRKNTVFIKINDEIKAVGDWADAIGIPDYKVYNAAKRGDFGLIVPAPKAFVKNP